MLYFIDMEISRSVINTLAFFELFEHPLTGFEIFKWLNCQEPHGLEEVLAALRENSAIKEANGFFFLGDEKEGERLIKKRQERLADNDGKMRQARKAARLISWVPFIRLAAVCNTLSFGAAKEKSDIDFFIIGKKGRLWTVRFFVMAILSLLGLRRRGQRIKNLICLSFFIADDNLDLRPIALPDKSIMPDIYLIYWITQLVPLVNREQTLEKFWQANAWVKKYLANFSFASQLPDYHQIKIPNWVEKWRLFHERVMGGQLGDWRERFFKRWQLRKMSVKESRRPAGGTGVIINDQILKFHEEDRREEYRQEWQKRTSP